MSLKPNKTRLTMVTLDLSNQWQQTRNYWRDAKSLEFEKEYIEELLASVEKAATVIDELDKLVTKIRNDCE